MCEIIGGKWNVGMIQSGKDNNIFLQQYDAGMLPFYYGVLIVSYEWCQYHCFDALSPFITRH